MLAGLESSEHLQGLLNYSSARRGIIVVNGLDQLVLDVYFSLFGYDMIDQMQIHLIMGIRRMPVGQIVERAQTFLFMNMLFGYHPVGKFQGIGEQVDRNPVQVA
jgi:hypothetical protein